jgi:hypothetical protein
MRHMRHFRALFPGKSPARDAADISVPALGRDEPVNPNELAVAKRRHRAASPPRSTTPHDPSGTFPTGRSRTPELSREARPRNPDRASIVSSRRRF